MSHSLPHSAEIWCGRACQRSPHFLITSGKGRTRRAQPLPPIINAQKISKAFGAQPLFQDLSFTVSEGSRIGLIGPNGSGKSTLLRILAGTEEPDSGNIAIRKRLRLLYVEQDSRFKAGETVRLVIDRAIESSANIDSEHDSHFRET